MIYTTNATSPSNFRLVFDNAYAAFNKKDQRAVLAGHYLSKEQLKKGFDANRHLATLSVEPNGSSPFIYGVFSYAHVDGELRTGRDKNKDMAGAPKLFVRINIPVNVADAIYAALKDQPTFKRAVGDSEHTVIASDWQLVFDIDDEAGDSFKQLQSSDKLDFHIQWANVRGVAVVTKGHEWYVEYVHTSNYVAEMSGRDVVKAMFAKAGAPAASVPRIESADVKAHLLARKTVGTSVTRLTVTPSTEAAIVNPAPNVSSVMPEGSDPAELF